MPTTETMTGTPMRGVGAEADVNAVITDLAGRLFDLIHAFSPEHRLVMAEAMTNISIAMLKGLAPIGQVRGYLSAAVSDCDSQQQIVCQFPVKH
jgi:hypothetical protein